MKLLECDYFSLFTGVAVAYIQQQGNADNLSVTPLNWLNEVLDSENSGVPKDIGKIAEFVYEWEGRVADELGLTKFDVNNIKLLHKDRLDLQV